jgi:uncharacterized protein YggE
MHVPHARLVTAAALLAALSAAGAVAFSPQPRLATANAELPRLLTVSASGQATARPDQAVTYLGVQSDGPTAGAAMQANGDRMNAVVERLKALGVEEKDIQTSGLSLFPVYARPGIRAGVAADPVEPSAPVQTTPTPSPPLPPGAPVPVAPVITGYRAVSNVTVTIRDIAKVAAVIDGAVERGANVVSGVSFGLSNPDGLREDALRRAVQAARAKANLLAGETGVTIVGVHNVSESGGYPGPISGPFLGKGGEAAAPAVAIEPGQLNVTASVGIAYLIQ